MPALKNAVTRFDRGQAPPPQRNRLIFYRPAIFESVIRKKKVVELQTGRGLRSARALAIGEPRPAGCAASGSSP